MAQKRDKYRRGTGVLDRETQQSAADTDQTVSTSTGVARKIIRVTVKYSGNATVNAIVTLKSGAGTAWDCVLGTMVLTNVKNGVFVPDGDEKISSDDVIDVLAPAGGVGITSSVAIYSEALS